MISLLNLGRQRRCKLLELEAKDLRDKAIDMEIIAIIF